MEGSAEVLPVGFPQCEHFSQGPTPGDKYFGMNHEGPWKDQAECYTKVYIGNGIGRGSHVEGFTSTLQPNRADALSPLKLVP